MVIQTVLIGKLDELEIDNINKYLKNKKIVHQKRKHFNNSLRWTISMMYSKNPLFIFYLLH